MKIEYKGIVIMLIYYVLCTKQKVRTDKHILTMNTDHHQHID